MVERVFDDFVVGHGRALGDEGRIAPTHGAGRSFRRTCQQTHSARGCNFAADWLVREAVISGDQPGGSR